ncbi:hypothetical protein [Listeria costaricensis]|uniref:glycan biosynthesis hexose transferase WsfD n=1 Tax=Listeria costaricensis TaxID=2026604 RepID=UPI001F098B44|nr:hypothetical protein [Listeria costaricensis]
MSEQRRISWKFHAKQILKKVTPAVFSVILLAVISIMILFIPPYIGLADNGDFFRAYSSNGLYHNQPNYDAMQFGYFVKEFGIYQYFNENQVAILSSQSLLIKAAIGLNSLFLHDGTFDVRFMAAIQLLLLLGAVYLLVEALTTRFKGIFAYLSAFIVVLVFGDTAYIAYFNSFYSEGLMMIMALYMAAALLLMYQKRYNDYFLLAVFFISSILLITAKQQNAPFGVIITFFGLLLLFIRREKKFRILTGSLLGVIFATGVAMYVFIPQEFVTINQYQTMTRGVLLKSDAPEKSLEQMGIDPEFSLLKGTTYFDKYKMIDPDSTWMQKNFYDHYGFVPVLKFYLTNPSELYAMLNLSAEHSFTIRPLEMGNYEKSAGKDFGEKTHFFTAYSSLKHALSPATFAFIILWAAIFLISYSRGLGQAFRERDYRGFLRLDLAVMLVMIGFSVLLITIVGDGEADLAKHEFMFNICFDISIVMMITSLLHGLANKAEKRRIKHENT